MPNLGILVVVISNAVFLSGAPFPRLPLAGVQGGGNARMYRKAAPEATWS